MKKIFLLGTVVLGLFSLAGCGGGNAGNTVTLAGSTAFQPFAEKLAEKFMETHPEVRINVQGGGSIVGLQAVRANAVQVAMADLVNLPDDIVDPNGVFTHTAVARDGIAVIVHPENPIKNLSTEQVSQIFQGKIENWKDVGGKDEEISVVSREKGSGTGKSFEDLVLKGAPLTKKSLFQESNGTVRETVSVIPNSIGYLFMGLLNEKVKPVDLDKQSPTEYNILKGKYKLVNQVYFIWNNQVDPVSKSFIDFVLSEEGQKIIAREGLIPVKDVKI